MTLEFFGFAFPWYGYKAISRILGFLTSVDIIPIRHCWSAVTPCTGDVPSLQVSHVVAVAFLACLNSQFLASISCNILAFPSLFLMSVWLIIIPLVGFSVTMPFDGGHLQECHGSFYLFKKSLSDSAKLKVPAPTLICCWQDLAIVNLLRLLLEKCLYIYKTTSTDWIFQHGCRLLCLYYYHRNSSTKWLHCDLCVTGKCVWNNLMLRSADVFSSVTGSRALHASVPYINFVVAWWPRGHRNWPYLLLLPTR